MTRHARSAWSLPLFAFGVSAAFVGLTVLQPLSPAYAETPVTAPGAGFAPTQGLTVAESVDNVVTRDGYTVKEAPKPVVVPTQAPTSTSTKQAASGSAKSTKSSSGSNSGSGSSATAPVAGTPDPGSAKAIAADLVAARGWGSDQYNCLVSLWNKESGWNVYAQNRSSGAYGIPQSLPGSKMASVGSDWRTNPATQITWGLNYIAGSYGTPCGAWGHSQSSGWY